VCVCASVCPHAQQLAARRMTHRIKSLVQRTSSTATLTRNPRVQRNQVHSHITPTIKQLLLQHPQRRSEDVQVARRTCRSSEPLEASTEASCCTLWKHAFAKPCRGADAQAVLRRWCSVTAAGCAHNQVSTTITHTHTHTHTHAHARTRAQQESTSAHRSKELT
jgi:hypothetical protein